MLENRATQRTQRVFYSAKRNKIERTQRDPILFRTTVILNFKLLVVLAVHAGKSPFRTSVNEGEVIREWLLVRKLCFQALIDDLHWTSPGAQRPFVSLHIAHSPFYALLSPLGLLCEINCCALQNLL